MAKILRTLLPPFRDKFIDENSNLTQSWFFFFKDLVNFVNPLGQEKTFDLLNNISTATLIPGFAFDKATEKCVFVDYLIQRVTTGTGATELISGGFLILVYKKASDSWEIQYNSIQSSGVFTAATTDVCTRAYHGFKLGDQVQVSSTGSLPSGLNTSVNYFVMPLTFDTFKLALSLSDAQNGIAVDITSVGSGIHTLYPNPGLQFSITTDGKVKYTTSNITGTPSISKLTIRPRTLSGANFV